MYTTLGNFNQVIKSRENNKKNVCRIVSDFYCSYGNPSTAYDFDLPFPIRHTNLQSHQSLFSNLCGVYVIYFLVHRTLGFTLAQIVNHFGPSPELNDQIIKSFYNSLTYIKPISQLDQKLQRCCTRLLNSLK